MDGWEPAFVAMGTILGEPADAIRAALADRSARAAALFHALKAPAREARAHALARTLAEVALAIEATRCR
jgi:hypothetical protein